MTLPRDEVVRLYVDEQFPAGRIADRFGVTPSAVYGLLVRAKVPRRPCPIPAAGVCPVRARVAALFTADGLSVDEIAGRTGLTRKVVRRHLTAAGLRAHRRHRSPGPRPPGPPVARGRNVSRHPSGYRAIGYVSKRHHVNLGLFRPCDYGGHAQAAAAARRAADSFRARLEPGRDEWEVVKELQRMIVDGFPVVPAHVLPRWVYRLPGRDGFGARTGKGRAAVHLPGPFATPEGAHEAMRTELGRRGRG